MDPNQAKGASSVDESIPALVEALKNQDAGVRRDAAQDLRKARLDWEEVLPVLVQVLRDCEVKIDWDPAEALGKIRAEVNVLVRGLVGALKDADLRVRQLAAEALGIVESVDDTDEGIFSLFNEFRRCRVETRHTMRRRARALERMGLRPGYVNGAVSVLTKSLETGAAFVRAVSTGALILMNKLDFDPGPKLREALAAC